METLKPKSKFTHKTIPNFFLKRIWGIERGAHMSVTDWNFHGISLRNWNGPDLINGIGREVVGSPNSMTAPPQG